MDIHLLTQFFLWGTILGMVILALWGACWYLMSDLIYRLEKTWFGMPEVSKETCALIFLGFIGIFKILWIVLFVIPLIALLIIG